MERAEWLYSIGWWVVHLFLKLYCRYEVSGLEYVPREGPMIIVSNHVSYVDPPALGMTTRRHLNFMAKRELFEIPLFGALIRKLGAFPVSRGRPDRRAFRRALEVLGRGEGLIMFPEGTRRTFGKLGEPDLGVAAIALRSRAPVVPVGLIGTHRIMPRGWPVLLPFKLRIRIGPPLTFDEYYGKKATKDELRQVAQAIMRSIAELCGYS